MMMFQADSSGEVRLKECEEEQDQQTGHLTLSVCEVTRGEGKRSGKGNMPGELGLSKEECGEQLGLWGGMRVEGGTEAGRWWERNGKKRRGGEGRGTAGDNNTPPPPSPPSSPPPPWCYPYAPPAPTRRTSHQQHLDTTSYIVSLVIG